ncbi:MAG: hypothetical protein ACLFTK_11945 [Anaerolineales bacterium]
MRTPPDYQVIPPDDSFYDAPNYGVDDDGDPVPIGGGCVSGPLRIAVVIIMILALVGGMLWQAWGVMPQLLGYWQNDYRLVLRTVYAGDCAAWSGGEGQSITPARQMCVCGTLQSGQEHAHVEIELRAPDGARVSQAALYERASGPFCHTLQAETLLEPGRYTLVATPRLSRQTIARLAFTVRDNRPDI